MKIVALACFVLISSVTRMSSAYCRSTTSRERAMTVGECVNSGLPLGWRSRCTGFSLYRAGVPAEIPWGELDRISRVSVDAWARVPCDADGTRTQYFRVLPNPPTWNLSGYNPRGQNSNTISFRHKWQDNPIHRLGAIAITIATFDSFTGEIYDADMELNTYDPATNPQGFRFSIEPIVSNPGAADLQTIFTHEFGHFMGLSHSSNSRSVMWFEAGLGEVRRDLSSDDSAGMCAIYPDSNTPQTRCVAVPYGGLTTQIDGTLITSGTGGGCHATPGKSSSRISIALLALVAFAATARKREQRSTPRL
jgi:Matrixin